MSDKVPRIRCITYETLLARNTYLFSSSSFRHKLPLHIDGYYSLAHFTGDHSLIENRLIYGLINIRYYGQFNSEPFS